MPMNLFLGVAGPQGSQGNESVLLCSIFSMVFQSWSLSPVGLQWGPSVSLSFSGGTQEQME